MPIPVYLIDCGTMPYNKIWDKQEKILAMNVERKKLEKQTSNYVLIVEHPPVITLGKNGNKNNLLLSSDVLASKQIEFVHTNRGGDITFHGLGQIVVYPILDLSMFKTDLGWYVRLIEEVVIQTLEEYDIVGCRSKGETGVWIDQVDSQPKRKIAAIGIRCSRWITMHGFALNVNLDTSYFDYIIPCGIADKKVTSMHLEIKRPIDINSVKSVLLSKFSRLFDLSLIPISDKFNK
ncbi:MAG: lipoyl(octanoyl) transferase LipB [Phycisphaerales bacterium]|nr:lipoyl(octanoyl) transferase LipB [Phycisphaerales bacterium]